MNYYSETLLNGLRIIHVPSSSPVSYCGFVVKTGTRDEEKEEQGMAHFVEHLLFKGTEKRRSWHILNRMESVGGELNACTTKEETFIYSVFLSRDIHRAMELLGDMVFHSTFPIQGIEKEREVILDEINSYEDSPSELIYDEFENILFNGHPLGRNILGTPESIQFFDTLMGLRFLKRFYIPSNMVFFSSGETPYKTISYCAHKYFSSIETSLGLPQRISPNSVLPCVQTMDKDTHQTHVLIGCPSYSLFDEKRNVLFFLNNLLGGPGMNSRLNVSLREKNGLVYDIESTVTNYSDTGVFSIYFASDPKNKEKCIALVLKELKKLRENKLTAVQMTKAQKQVIGQIAIASDNRESTILNIAKSYLYFNKCEEEKELYKKIEMITREQILETANEILDEKRLFQLIFR